VLTVIKYSIEYLIEYLIEYSTLEYRLICDVTNLM